MTAPLAIHQALMWTEALFVLHFGTGPNPIA